MRKKHHFLCGGVNRRIPEQSERHELQLGMGPKMIRLDAETISRRMVQKIPPVMMDLLQVATYVYCGDQMVSRGGKVEFEYGDKWHRCLHFDIPVQEIERWTDPGVKDLLEETLSFASADTYSFKFHSQEPGQMPDFLNFVEDPGVGFMPDAVVLFSGGLDSFTGAIDEVFGHNHRVALVSHQSNNKMTKLQRILHEYIHKLCDGKQKTMHVPVVINKDKCLTRETSQRSRSFLFAALGATVAYMFDLRKVTFYENGIVSCNLPFDSQTPQARRTRSTHPKVLADLSSLVSELIEEEFSFVNPYFFNTKTDVVERLKTLHHEPYISKTRSCAAAIFRLPHTHCGTCSQCIDRRLAVLAVKCQEYDPEWAYAIELFKGPRESVQDRAMVAGFAGQAVRLSEMTPSTFWKAFSSDLLEMLGYQVNMRREAELEKIFDMHTRHARQVNGVVSAAMSANSNAMLQGTLPSTCLLSMIGRGEHLDIQTIPEKAASEPKSEQKPATGEAESADYAFYRNGDFWVIAFDGKKAGSLKDVKGLQWIHYLLSNPNKNILAIDLYHLGKIPTSSPRTGGHGKTSEAELAKPGLNITNLGSSEEIIDNEALAAYQKRLKELEDKQEIALSTGDTTRATEAKEEIKQIRLQLVEASGLGERKRKTNSPVEQARINISKRIHVAIRKIGKDLPSLKEHLGSTIRTGQLCSYNPDPDNAIPWVL